MKKAHYPKGSMCMACRYALADCGRLPFSTMPPMSQHKDRVIVRCTEFASTHTAPPPQGALA